MSEYNRHRWAMEWMYGGGRDPKGRGLDEEIKLGKEDWMERQRVAHIIPEFDELSPREEQYYQQPPFSTNEVFLGAKGGPAQLVQPGPGRPGYRGTPVIPSILEELKGTKSTSVDLEAILKNYEITARSSKKNIKDRLIKEGYKIKKSPVSRQVENVIKKLATYESSVDREKLQNLYELIVDANNTDTGLLIKHDKKLADKSASVLMKEAGFGKTMKPGANRFAQELIDRHLVSTKNKMRTALKTMLSNENAAFDGLTKPIEQIAKRFGVKDSVMRTALQDFPFYKQNKEMITRLGHADFIKKWKGQDLLLADVAELAELKPLRPYFNRGPEGLIQQMAYRHFKAGGDKINFLTHPDQYDPKDWKFEYKGKTYDYLDLARTRDDPNFKSVWKALDDVKNYEEFKITDPKILKKFGYKKPTNLGTIMRKAYGVGTGKKGYFYSRVKDIDHFGNILEEPFENLRALDARTNRAAGHIDLHLSGDEAIKAKKKIGYFNQIDYNDVNAFNQMVDRDLNLARDILIPSERYPTGRKLRTGYNIGKEYAQKTVPKGTKISVPAGSSRVASVAGVLDDALKTKTAKKVGRFFTKAGAPFEAGFIVTDYYNNLGRGMSKEEAWQTALSNATFGIYEGGSRAREKGLIDLAEAQGYSDWQVDGLKTMMSYKKLEDELRSEKAKLKWLMGEQESGVGSITGEDIAGQIEQQKDLISQMETGINDLGEKYWATVPEGEDFNTGKMFDDLLGYKARQEYNENVEDRKHRVNPDMGPVGSPLWEALSDWKTYLPQNLMETTQATQPVVRNLRKLPGILGEMWEPTSEQAILSAMTPEELEERAAKLNIKRQTYDPMHETSTMTYDQMDPYYSDFEYMYKAKGGRVSYLDGGIVSLLKK